MKRNMIILGASGFIGSNIVKHYLSCCPDNVKGFSSQECDMLSLKSIENNLSFIKEDDVIIMASAITRLKENSFESMVKNIRMAENISSFIENNKVAYMVFLSTVDIYGLIKQGTMINEKLLPDPNDYYAMSKLSSEYILKKMCHKRHIPLLILRLSGVYGPGDAGKSTINKLVESAVINKKVVIYGDGGDKRDFVYIEDLCNILRIAVDHKINGTFNVATGKSSSIKEIVDVIKQSTGSEFLVEFKEDTNQHEERVKDMVYDVSLFTSTFIDIKLKGISEGVYRYLNAYKP